ncbi:enoyl-CoA hydratase-related protein [Tardiphaga sp. 71_E8_N1_1]|uniref:enoyl-CoA hydratase-related protein n=1 Tax=Tardiphaga sp. 71_E8_N1_1 TaxID=3240784 RepID=UPI003F8997C4
MSSLLSCGSPRKRTLDPSGARHRLETAVSDVPQPTEGSNSMSQQVVRYEVTDKVAHISLDRPPVNALSLDLIRAVVAAFKRAADDDAARAVVLSSAIARRFSAGPLSIYLFPNLSCSPSCCRTYRTSCRSHSAPA